MEHAKLFDLGGRVAVITGGSRGLGKEMADALGRAGADLVVAARTEKDLAAAAADLSASTGRRVLPVVLDVTNRESVQAMVDRTVAEFGRLDVLVNSAGTNIRSPLAKIRDEDWHTVQQVNVTGTFMCCRAAAPVMVAAGFGRIINVGSALSLVGLPERVSYTAAKGAVLQMTRTLAAEFAKTGVTANCLCPGPFATELNKPVLANPQASSFLLSHIPMGRWAEMHEIRSSVVFLASPASSYVTGCALTVDGGWTIE